ncbi:MAG TPA: SDR family oxidoreductase [Acidimicrobiales bacterium]|nr:SDR family oxidoreductase [Acidimicrobiales bacterium]
MSPRRKRTVVVTGSASGIGAAVRDRFARSGARVVGVDLAGAEVHGDLSTAAGRQAAVAAVIDACDGCADGLVACAGLGPHVRPTPAIVAVNYFGALAVLDGLLPALEAGDAAAAAVVASNSAGITPPNPGLLDALAAEDEQTATSLAGALDGATVYGMSKLALARSIRRRVRAFGQAGVRLNAVAPGPVDTPLLAASLEDPTLGPLVDALPVPLGRRAAPEEIAGAIAFLLDPANGYVHGSVLFVDGGTDALLRPDAV